VLARHGRRGGAGLHIVVHPHEVRSLVADGGRRGRRQPHGASHQRRAHAPARQAHRIPPDRPARTLCPLPAERHRAAFVAMASFPPREVEATSRGSRRFPGGTPRCVTTRSITARCWTRTSCWTRTCRA